MKQFINLIRSIVSDMRLLGKPFINYTLAYIGLAVVSNALSLFNSSNQAVNSLITLLILAVAVLQTAAIIYFQRAYIKQQIGNVVFNSIFAVILRLYFIYFIQLIIIAVPVILVMLIFYSPQSYGSAFFSVMDWVGRGLVFIFLLYWFSRLVFVPTILVYKKESMKMKLIIAESKAIFRKNFFVVLPFFLILFATAFYAGFTIMDNPQYTPSLARVIFLTCNAYISSILYCKLVINYQLHMASKYLPQTSSAQE
jgi:putative membrane protein